MLIGSTRTRYAPPASLAFFASSFAFIEARWSSWRAAKTPSDKRTPRRWTPSTQKRPTPAPRSPGTQLFAVPEAVTPSDDYESEAFDDYETPSK